MLQNWLSGENTEQNWLSRENTNWLSRVERTQNTEMKSSTEGGVQGDIPCLLMSWVKGSRDQGDNNQIHNDTRLGGKSKRKI